MAGSGEALLPFTTVEPLDWTRTFTTGQELSAKSMADFVELSLRLIRKDVVNTGLDLLSVAGGAAGMVYWMTYLSTV